jgi:putative AbiEi antitoxin of type IV toxin-antitoxin system
MAAITTSRTRAKKIFRQYRNMLRTGDAIRLGIHPETLYSLRDTGEIEQIGRGLYRLAGAPLANPDWTAVGTRIPQAVIC